MIQNHRSVEADTVKKHECAGWLLALVLRGNINGDGSVGIGKNLRIRQLEVEYLSRRNSRLAFRIGAERVCVGRARVFLDEDRRGVRLRILRAALSRHGKGEECAHKTVPQHGSQHHCLILASNREAPTDFWPSDEGPRRTEIQADGSSRARRFDSICVCLAARLSPQT